MQKLFQHINIFLPPSADCRAQLLIRWGLLVTESYISWRLFL